MRHYLLNFVFLFLASNMVHAGALERLFAPKADLWPYWAEYNAASTQAIDHTLWDRFLQTYVQQGDDGINRVAYAAVSSRDLNLLQQYISQLENIPIREYSRSEQLAYWVNLYNAVTVNIVLQHYPVNDIRDINISPGLFAIGPWGKKVLEIDGKPVSLNDIEHRILRPIWKDPRLHYILNCASLGCPNLYSRAYQARSINELLDKAAHEYINHPRGVVFKSGKLYVSSIYSWFRVDFGNSEPAVIQHLIEYASDDLARALSETTQISGDDYNWKLNDVDPVTPGRSNTDEY